jgi:hypothetical protein
MRAGNAATTFTSINAQSDTTITVLAGTVGSGTALM